jgi:hypothetical protein
MVGMVQEDVIRHLQVQGADSELVRTLYLQELNRVKYMMRAYMRCRLLKIEKFVMHVLDNEEEQEKLSPQELHHAQVPHKHNFIDPVASTKRLHSNAVSFEG